MIPSKMYCFITVFLAIYFIQHDVNAVLNEEQTRCIGVVKKDFNVDDLDYRPDRYYYASYALLHLRVSKHSSRNTFKSEDGKNYYYEIFGYMTPGPKMNSIRSYCKKKLVEACINQLTEHFPVNIDNKEEILEYIYKQKVYSDIPTEHNFALDFMNHVSKTFTIIYQNVHPDKNITHKELRFPGYYCMDVYRTVRDFEPEETHPSKLQKAQAKCIDLIKDEFGVSKNERVFRELCAEKAFLNHRMSKDLNETTLVSDDAKNYYMEISAYLVSSPTMQTINFYCSSLDEDNRTNCKEQLEKNFPVDDFDDPQSILNYLYHNKTIKEIPDNDQVYSNTNSIFAKKLRSPSAYCIDLYRGKRRKPKKQRQV